MVVRRIAALTLLIGVVSGSLAATRPARADSLTVTDHTITVMDGPASDQKLAIDTTLYRPGSATADHPAPAVIVSPGFGGTKGSVASDAKRLAGQGYVTLTWSMRGFGKTGGKIALDSADYDVKDLSGLVDWLATQPGVLLDAPNDPRVALVGGSYGGGIALQGAAYDHRIDAIVPIITWNSLVTAFLPDAAGHAGVDGVFKSQWASYFFAGGPGGTCARIVEPLCSTYDRVAESGRADQQAVSALAASSPATVISRIKVPTLLIQGEHDTLFPLSESIANADAIKANGAPVKLMWVTGGHDQSFTASDNNRINDATKAWLARYLKKDSAVDTGPVFSWASSTGGIGEADRWPAATAAATVELPAGKTQTIANPAGGQPAAITSIPGAGSFGALGSLLGQVSSFQLPGQTASWQTPPLTKSREINGAATVRLRVTSTTGQAVLYAALYDVDQQGKPSLPGGLIAPARITEIPAAGKEVAINLPAISTVFAAGHRIRLVVATTDAAFAGSRTSATYTVTLLAAPKAAAPAIAEARRPADYNPLWIAFVVAVVLIAGALALGAVVTRRRKPRIAPDAPLVEVRELTKEFGSGVRAVDHFSMTVRRGQVVGLLGPNGAGKTTTLRMIAGLIQPTSGEVSLFGTPVTPGCPELSRVGLFVEGPGFVPHLSGLDNLRFYWRSDARSMAASGIDEALAIAGLGDAINRPVRTYSQGMRQRLAIAQAMLGRPDLLILDEPTNGLDPPQIKAMRETLRAIAGSGRTVLVSSHLLAEVEQTCTHVVVMARGRFVAAGTVAEMVAGAGPVHVEVAGDLDQAERIARSVPRIASVERVDGGLVVELNGVPRAEFLRTLVDAGVDVDGLRSHRRLEDVFMGLVEHS